MTDENEPIDHEYTVSICEPASKVSWAAILSGSPVGFERQAMELRTIFQASAELKIPTLTIKAAVIAGRIPNHGGELTSEIRIDLAEARAWFNEENGQPTKATKKRGRK